MLGAPGTILADRYRLGDEIGRGGMGAVSRATALRTGGPVAVKALPPAWARDPVYRERLRREAQAAAVLPSPRVARVGDLDAGAEPPYLVLEYVAGETLQARLRREGQLDGPLTRRRRGRARPGRRQRRRAAPAHRGALAMMAAETTSSPPARPPQEDADGRAARHP